jgi:hypothetical protein
MTTRAKEIAAEGPYTVEAFEIKRTLKPQIYFRVVGPTPTGLHSTTQKYAANRLCDRLNAAYKQGQQDRWIPVSQFKAPAPGQTILFGSKNTVRMWTWDANNDEPPSSWATHYRLIELPPNPDQP